YRTSPQRLTRAARGSVPPSAANRRLRKPPVTLWTIAGLSPTTRPAAAAPSTHCWERGHPFASPRACPELAEGMAALPGDGRAPSWRQASSRYDPAAATITIAIG